MARVLPVVGLVKLYEDAKCPERMTQLSACYDVFCYLNPKEKIYIKMFDAYDNEYKIPLNDDKFMISPFCRALIPTGCKFKIPSGYSIRLHPRSGKAFKEGITLANCEGVIDADYPEQTFILLINQTFLPKTIKHHERLCQLELVPVVEFQFFNLSEDFGQITDRVSGVGSTGA